MTRTLDVESVPVHGAADGVEIAPPLPRPPPPAPPPPAPPPPAPPPPARPPPAPIPSQPPAFRRIYDEHFPFVWRSLRRLGVPEPDLPDAAQETFVVVHRRLGEFEGRAKLTTWLFRICLNVARQERARRHKRREDPDTDLLGEVAAPEPEASVIVERCGAASRVLAALEALDLDQRAVFTLFELEGYSGSEIAALLVVPVPTVHSRLRLGREAFRRELDRLEAVSVGDAERRRRSS